MSNDVKDAESNPYGLLPREKNTPTVEHLQSAQSHLSVAVAALDGAMKVLSGDDSGNETLWSDILAMNATVTVLSRKDGKCQFPDLMSFGHFYRLFSSGKQPVRGALLVRIVRFSLIDCSLVLWYGRSGFCIGEGLESVRWKCRNPHLSHRAQGESDRGRRPSARDRRGITPSQGGLAICRAKCRV